MTACPDNFRFGKTGDAKKSTFVSICYYDIAKG